MDTGNQAELSKNPTDEYRGETFTKSNRPTKPPSPSSSFREFTPLSTNRLRYDKSRHMIFYATINTPGAAQGLLEPVAENSSNKCTIL